jgi:uncharacterized membrane protein
MLCGCGTVNGHGEGKAPLMGAGILLMIFTWVANIIFLIVIEVINLKRPHAKPSVVLFVLLGLLSLFDLKILVMFLQGAVVKGLVMFLCLYFPWVLDWILLMRYRSHYKQENRTKEYVPKDDLNYILKNVEHSDSDRQ